MNTITINWPRFTAFDAFTIIVLILIVWVIFLYLRYKNDRKMQHESIWYKLFARYRSDITVEQANLLKIFFYQYPQKDAEKLLHDKKIFYKSLSRFLETRQEENPASRAKMLNNIFFNNQRDDKGISSWDDVKAGEGCTVVMGKNHYMGRIMRINDSEAVIRTTETPDCKILKNKKAALHIYREHYGTYVITGRISDAGDNYIFLKHEGNVQLLHKRQLVADVNVPVTFLPWPVVEDIITLKKEGSQAKTHKKKALIKKKQNTIVHGKTSILSERALGFLPDSDDDRERIDDNSNQIWEMFLSLSDDSTVTCRGHFIYTHNDQKSGFYFKFADLSEQDHKKLFDYIKNNEPYPGTVY